MTSTQIDHHAPVVGSSSIYIDADPETVFSIVADVDRWPSWNPAVKSAALSGPLQPGAVFRWRSGTGTIVSTLEVVDPPHELSWTGASMGIRAIHVFRFEPHGGGTLTCSAESWDGFVVRRLARTGRRVLARAIDAQIVHLKVAAERNLADA